MNSGPFKGKACGKFILLGDHFVAHGTPALAFPLHDLVCEVILDVVADAQSDKPLAHDTTQEALHRARQGLGLDRHDVLFRIRSSSNFEISRGFGSSASFATALVRALIDFQCSNGLSQPTDATVAAALQSIESLFHANPSGVDATTIWCERPVIFQKGQPTKTVSNEAMDFVLTDAGSRKGTAELVTRTTCFKNTHADRWNELSNEVTALVRESAILLKQGGTQAQTCLAQAMTEAHKILAEVGLSTLHIDDLIARAQRLGALAGKVSGAGTGGAVVLATEAGHGRKLAQKMIELGMPVVAMVEANGL